MSEYLFELGRVSLKRRRWNMFDNTETYRVLLPFDVIELIKAYDGVYPYCAEVLGRGMPAVILFDMPIPLHHTIRDRLPCGTFFTRSPSGRFYAAVALCDMTQQEGIGALSIDEAIAMREKGITACSIRDAILEEARRKSPAIEEILKPFFL